MDDPRQEDPATEDELRVFVARKLGDLQAQFSKLIALLEHLLPAQTYQRSLRNQQLLYLLIALMLLNYVLLGLHIALTSGWL